MGLILTDMAGYTGHRKVPKKIQIVGNVLAGKKYIGVADSRLKVLEQQMTFQNLSQGASTYSPQKGVVIECWSCFSLQGVKITVLSGGNLKKEKKKYSCDCYPCYTFGVILEVHELSQASYDIGIKYSYDIALCRSSKHLDIYRNFDNIKSASWGKYYKRQYVMVGGFCDNTCFDTIAQKCVTEVLELDIIDFNVSDMLVLPVFNAGRMRKLRESDDYAI